MAINSRPGRPSIHRRAWSLLAWLLLLGSLDVGAAAAESRELEPIDRAQALEARGAYAEAAALWLQILAARQRRLAPDHPDIGASLNNLGLLHEQQGRDQEAEDFYRRALAIAAKSLAPDHPDLASGLNNLALLHLKQGRSSEAEPLLMKALAIREKALGASHPDTGTSAGNLATLHERQGRYQEAERGYLRALKIHETSLGGEHPGTATSLNNLAAFYDHIQGRHDEAEALFRRALAIHEHQLGPEHPLTATSLANLAVHHERIGRYPEAVDLFHRALSIRLKILGDNHPDTATSLHQLAALHGRLGDYAKAEPMLRQAVAIHTAVETSPRLLAGSLNALASVLRAQARYEEAESLYRRSLAIHESAPGNQAVELATTLHELASLHVIQGLYSTAEPLLRRALAIVANSLGGDHLNTAASLNDLGLLLEKQGRYGEAETFYARSLVILEKSLGGRHPDVATTLNNLALLQQKQGRLAEAEPLLERALQARQQSLGAEHPDTAASLDHLATLYASQGRQEKAEQLYQRALRIREGRLGPTHPHTAASLNNLALFYERQGRAGEAEPLHRRALMLSEQALGGGHPHVATSLNNLALLHAFQGNLQPAETLARRALLIREQGLGPLHPDTATSLNTLSLTQLLQGSTTAATPLLTRLARNQSDWLRRELPLQPRELRSSLLAQQEDAVASAFALLDQDPAGLPLALETRLNRQGLLAEIERRQRLLMDSSGETRELAERIAALDRQLALASRTRSEAEPLRAQRQRLEGELHRLLPEMRIDAVSVSQVAAALRELAPRGVLIEFQRYRPLQRSSSQRRGGAAGPWGSPRYVALLLHADGRSVSVPLGEAGAIDQAVGRALAASGTGQPEAAALWRRLSELVLTPLLPHLQGVNELFLSPDGGLHRVPFAALPAPGDGERLLNEAYQLRLVTTGRDLLRLRQPGREGGTAVLIANPDYNARRQPARAGAGRASAAPFWPPLPGTAEEARSLAPMLQVKQPITAEAATAALVLDQKAPRILHIATHGFFRADRPAVPGPTGLWSGSSGGGAPILRDDPLLRSGLVMAGANHPDADPADDGYLTAAEATGMDLNGTHLVTLSACQSGLGDLQTGEGVYGLQRALSVAGARSTLLSLWSVDDAGTRAFMEAFYARLMQGEGRAEALARTQAAFRHHANPQFRHVYIWGAFQLSGDWRPITTEMAAAPGG